MRTYTMIESKVLLFIHAAYEDNKFDDSERAFIANTFSTVNVEKIIEEYEQLEPGPKIEIITDLIFDMVSYAGSFDQMKTELLLLFAVDGDVSKFETRFLNLLVKMEGVIAV